jgi:hypothetical protein
MSPRIYHLSGATQTCKLARPGFGRPNLFSELNLTAARRRLSFQTNIMADIPPINPGAPAGDAGSPMKKSTGRVQPKKETVRINLPPKPTAAPTIKLPTLPPGGPTGASSGMPASHAAPIAQTTLRSSAAAPAAQSRAAAPIQRPAAAPTLSGMDKILAIAACVAALVAVGTTAWMLLILNGSLNQ